MSRMRDILDYGEPLYWTFTALITPVIFCFEINTGRIGASHPVLNNPEPLPPYLYRGDNYSTFCAG